MNKRLLLILIVLSIIFSTFVLNNAFAIEKIDILAVSGSSGGGWYSIMGSIAEIIKQEEPNINIKATPGHSFANVLRVANNEAQIGFTFPMWITQALEHSGDYATRPKIEEGSLLALASGFGSAPMQFTVATEFAEQYGIETVKDLIDKKVPMKLAIGVAGTHSIWVIEKIFALYGATFPEDVVSWGGIIHQGGYTEQVQLMKDGHANVLIIDVNPPCAPIIEITLSKKLKFIHLPQDARDYMVEKQGHVYEVIPANTYKDQDFDIPTVTMLTVLITNDTVPEEVAYSIVKILAKNKETLQSLSKALEKFNPETAWKGLVAPLHPGAEKAYRELGYME